MCYGADPKRSRVTPHRPAAAHRRIGILTGLRGPFRRGGEVLERNVNVAADGGADGSEDHAEEFEHARVRVDRGSRNVRIVRSTSYGEAQRGIRPSGD
jgi:hypothetical protein